MNNIGIFGALFIDKFLFPLQQAILPHYIGAFEWYYNAVFINQIKYLIL